MRNNYIVLTAFALTSIGLILTSNSSGPASNGNRATGAPGDATACTSCHTGGSFGTVTIGFDLADGNGDPVTEYTPGETYSISVNVSASSGTPNGYGFQVIALEDAGETPLNAFANAGTGVQFSESNSRQYAEHTGPSTTGDFTFDWTAPAEGTGDVTFYAGANAINGNGNNSEDNAALSDFTFPEAPGDPTGLIAIQYAGLNMFPNPVQHEATIDGVEMGSKILIFSVRGELVRQETMRSNRIDLSDLVPGMYILRTDEALVRFVKI